MIDDNAIINTFYDDTREVLERILEKDIYNEYINFLMKCLIGYFPILNDQQLKRKIFGANMPVIVYEIESTLCHFCPADHCDTCSVLAYLFKYKPDPTVLSYEWKVVNETPLASSTWDFVGLIQNRLPKYNGLMIDSSLKTAHIDFTEPVTCEDLRDLFPYAIFKATKHNVDQARRLTHR